MKLNNEIEFQLHNGALIMLYEGYRVYSEIFTHNNIIKHIKNKDTIDCVFMLNCDGYIVFEIGKIQKSQNDEYDILFLDTYNSKYNKAKRKEYEYIVNFCVLN